MIDLNKRLVEVEYILKRLDDNYINKIPQEVWNYIEENKDKSYMFNYDESKALIDQNLSVDTISILTYINMEYLLNEEQKKEMKELLKKDEAIAEQQKREMYNPENIFKNKKIENIQEEQVSLVEIKKEKWYEKLFSFLTKMFRKK